MTTTTCHRCHAVLPAVPAQLDPLRWDGASWHARMRRRAHLGRVVAELETHAQACSRVAWLTGRTSQLLPRGVPA